jgi:hypothetical protein
VDVTRAALVVLEVLREAGSKAKKVTFKQLVDDAMKSGRKRAKQDRSEAKKTTKKAAATSCSSSSSTSFSSLSPPRSAFLQCPLAEVLGDQGRLEWLTAALFLEGVLAEDFHYTAYSTIVYCRPGDQASALEAGAKSVAVSFPKATISESQSGGSSSRTPAAAAAAAVAPLKSSSSSSFSVQTTSATSIRGTAKPFSRDDGDVIVLDDEDEDGDDTGFSNTSSGMSNRPTSNKRRSPTRFSEVVLSSGSEDEEEDSDDDFEVQRKQRRV